METGIHHNVVKSYARQARVYDFVFRNYLDGTLNVALDLMNLNGSELVLDVACGTGELERRIFQKFPKQLVCGIDLSEEMLRRARTKLIDYPQVNLVRSDSRHLPFPDNHFDTVVSCSAFHYMREPEKVLNEAARVLKPGGRLILIDWCYDFLFGKLYHHFRKAFFPSHYAVYGLTQLQEMMLQAGLKPVAAETFRVQFFWRMMGMVAAK